MCKKPELSEKQAFEAKRAEITARKRAELRNSKGKYTDYARVAGYKGNWQTEGLQWPSGDPKEWQIWEMGFKICLKLVSPKVVKLLGEVRNHEHQAAPEDMERQAERLFVSFAMSWLCVVPEG